MYAYISKIRVYTKKIFIMKQDIKFQIQPGAQLFEF